MRCTRPLAPLLFPWRRDHVQPMLSLMRSGRAVSMARMSMGCVCVVARAAPRPPPPLCSLFPWWCRDHICLPPWGSSRGSVDALLAPRRAALALRRGRPLTPLPMRMSFPWLAPSALVISLTPQSCSVVTAVEEEWQMVDGWCRLHCSMAHASTGGIGVTARVAPQPPSRAYCPPGTAVVFNRHHC